MTAFNNIIISGISGSGKTSFVTSQIKDQNNIKERLSDHLHQDQDYNNGNLSLVTDAAFKLASFNKNDQVNLVIDEINMIDTFNDEQWLQKQIKQVFQLALKSQYEYSRTPTINTIYWIGTNQELIHRIVKQAMVELSNPNSDKFNEINTQYSKMSQQGKTGKEYNFDLWRVVLK